jgi:hypothetical protein
MPGHDYTFPGLKAESRELEEGHLSNGRDHLDRFELPKLRGRNNDERVLDSFLVLTCQEELPWALSGLETGDLDRRLLESCFGGTRAWGGTASRNPQAVGWR